MENELKGWSDLALGWVKTFTGNDKPAPAPKPAPVKKTNWPLIGGIAAGVALLLVVLMRRGR